MYCKISTISPGGRVTEVIIKYDNDGRNQNNNSAEAEAEYEFVTKNVTDPR